MSGLSLYIWSKTWMRDSHGLFDYESDHISKSLFEVRSGGYLDRHEHSVQFLPQSPVNGLPGPLIAVQPSAESYRVALCSEEGSLWTVVRFLPGPKKGLELDTNSVIKLGRVIFNVKEIGEGLESELSDPIPCETSVDNDEEGGEERICRICYERQISSENPLLSPCRCDGTVKYLHLNCLKMWIKSKVTHRKTDSSITYQWKTIECDICKLELPLTLKTKTAQLSLFQHDKPAAPYIVLEARPTDRAGAKSLHVIMMTNGKQTIRLGRGHDSDVRINDISVSRCHAMIRYEAGRFLIEDNDSKFGTLVSAPKQIDLREETSTTVQVGRSLLKLEVKRANGKTSEGAFRQIPVDELSP